MKMHIVWFYQIKTTWTTFDRNKYVKQLWNGCHCLYWNILKYLLPSFIKLLDAFINSTLNMHMVVIVYWSNPWHVSWQKFLIVRLVVSLGYISLYNEKFYWRILSKYFLFLSTACLLSGRIQTRHRKAELPPANWKYCSGKCII